MKHTLVAWMRDKPGVLNRVSGLLRRRNFNIDSLQVGHSEQGGISRMTFVVDGDEHMVDQVIKQMRKLVDVTRIDNISERLTVVRELALIRVRTTPETRSEIIQIVDIYRGEVVDVALDSMVVQIVGSEDRVDSLIGLMENFGVMEMARTGRVAMLRGSTERRKRGSSVWSARAANGMEAATATDLFSKGGV
ncbi:MAG: acetolactate synthase small subunit [Caldilineaceae bacterium]